jgi:hypothetical protein
MAFKTAGFSAVNASCPPLIFIFTFDTYFLGNGVRLGAIQ